MKIRLRDIIGVLKAYKDQYLWLDVFASEVAEFSEKSFLSTLYKTDQPDTYKTTHEGQRLKIVLDRPNNLARFRLLEDSSEQLSGTLVGAATGAAMGGFLSAATRSSPAGIGVLLGLLVGGLIGHQLSAEQRSDEQADDNRILTLGYDLEEETWKVYHGAYRGYAKSALHPSIANAD